MTTHLAAAVGQGFEDVRVLSKLLTLPETNKSNLEVFSFAPCILFCDQTNLWIYRMCLTFTINCDLLVRINLWKEVSRTAKHTVDMALEDTVWKKCVATQKAYGARCGITISKPHCLQRFQKGSQGMGSIRESYNFCEYSYPLPLATY